jgi:hypothetical protein
MKRIVGRKIVDDEEEKEKLFTVVKTTTNVEEYTVMAVDECDAVVQVVLFGEVIYG